MPLETGTYISDLNPANPSGTDSMAQGDDHLRWIKSALKNTFPNISAAVTATAAQIDAAVNAVVKGTVASLVAAGTVGAPAIAPQADTDTGIYFPAEDAVAIAVNGAQAVQVNADKSVSLAAGLTAVGPLAGAAVSGAGMVPIGAGLEWYSDTLPPTTEGVFAWANGAAISRTTYATAFTRLGTQFGAGDGTTTFNLPDKKERVSVGKSTMGGAASPGLIPQYTTNTLGSQIGEGKHQLSTAELPSHTPSGTIGGSYTTPSRYNPDTNITNGVANGAGAAFGGLPNQPSGAQITVPGSSFTFTGNSIGGDTPHNIVQPGFVCNFIIRIA